MAAEEENVHHSMGTIMKDWPQFTANQTRPRVTAAAWKKYPKYVEDEAP